MLHVKTKIAPSAIHGFGLFADQFIPTDTIVWKFTPGFDLKFSNDEISKLPKNVQNFLDTYAYLSKKSRLYILPSDNAKYFNHSDNPNTLSEYLDGEEEVVTRAIKDIQKDEEITDNYDSFEENSQAYLE